MECVLCVHHASPTLLLDHAESSDDVREREHICFCCYSNRMEKERGRERKEERRERREKRVIRDGRDWWNCWADLACDKPRLSPISHAPSYCTGCEDKEILSRFCLFFTVLRKILKKCLAKNYL